MDVETFFDRIRQALINLIRRELNSLNSARVTRLCGLGLLGKTMRDRKGLS